ncbi:MAG TPA: DUF4349 domain-containing protein [Solirubrobacterales bacterium]
MEMRRDNFDIAAELRALRPAPTPAFATELDRRAAAGFPPTSSPEDSAWSRLTGRLRAASPRRLALPAGAAALTAVVIATAVIAIGEGGRPTSPPRQVADTGRHDGERSSDHRVHGDETPAAGHAGLKGQAGLAYSFSDASPTAGAAASLSGGAESASGSSSNSGYLLQTAPSVTGAQRHVERGAELVLRSGPGEIAAAAKGVFAAVHAAHGIVLSSSIHDWTGNAGSHAGEARAAFELLIPSARLGDAMASLSAIADVRSRHESTLDITAPTITVSDRLKDSEARIDGLLAQLASAESDGERGAVEAELRGERRQAAALRSRLDRLQSRSNFARVSLRVESGRPTASDSGRWGAGDALDDAGHILATAAGVAVVGLAIIGPPALIALLVWLVNRTWVRRRREQALG